MKKHIPFILYTILYTLASLFTLTRFPLIHSDEAWLAGLTQTMMAKGSLFTTESFFDLMPRTPHLIKVFYHGLQIPLIHLFGYHIFSVRLLSLIALLAGMIMLYMWLTQKNINPLHQLLLVILITSHIQIIYASHFARQEMILLLVLILCIYLYHQNPEKVTRLGLVLGLAIGFHPNAFIIASLIGALVLKDTCIKKITIRKLILFVLTLGFFALAFAGISLILNPGFIKEYFAYGQSLGVDAAPASRLLNFKDFYLKIFYQITGTYYIPNIKWVLIIGYGLALLQLAVIPVILIYKRTKKEVLTDHLSSWPFNLSLMVIAFNLALFIIGRYNTTSILFLVFVLLLLTGLSILSLMDSNPSKQSSPTDREFLNHLHYPSSLIVGLFLVLIFLNLKVVYDDYQAVSSQDYAYYEKQILNSMEEDAVILGNLSSGFIFKDHDFYDIRNLAFLGDQSISDYIKDRGINTIIYYEEYDYIHRNPMWTILYGDDDYYDDLKDFLNKKATLKGTFEDSFYGSRMIRYMGDYPWKIYIYEITDD